MLMFLSQLQTDEHFSFLKLKICILVTKNCLEIEDVLNFESSEAFKGKKVVLAKAALKISKIQIFSFREEKC